VLPGGAAKREETKARRIEIKAEGAEAKTIEAKPEAFPKQRPDKS